MKDNLDCKCWQVTGNCVSTVEIRTAELTSQLAYGNHCRLTARFGNIWLEQKWYVLSLLSKAHEARHALCSCSLIRWRKPKPWGASQRQTAGEAPGPWPVTPDTRTQQTAAQHDTVSVQHSWTSSNLCGKLRSSQCDFGGTENASMCAIVEYGTGIKHQYPNPLKVVI